MPKSSRPDALRLRLHRLPVVQCALVRTLSAGLAAVAFLGGLAGCASLPTQGATQPTFAINDVSETRLSGITKPVVPTDGRSGFILQPFGPNSFATRIELTKLAERSLDVQYYLLANDDTGRSLMRALRDASMRGVRVRVLVDDLYTVGEDDLLLGLASYPNVEVRLFNPFPSLRGSEVLRFAAAGVHFSQLNRRMHNKLFVADNVAAVAGGRNMADQYVQNTDGRNFIDMDVFAAGPVVRDLSAEFDTYWNSAVVFPVGQIVASGRSAGQLQALFEELTSHARPPEATEIGADGSVPDPSTGSPSSVSHDLIAMLNLPFELSRGRIGPLIPANARVLFDPISKTEGLNEDLNSNKGTVNEAVMTWLRTARTRIRLVTPYFIPTKPGMASLIEARDAGISVALVTNSLASTDVPAVYIDYWGHIHELLEAGVEIYEVSPTLAVKHHNLGIFGHRTAALHMKNAILDHKDVFLGTLNLDPRSARLNTEVGLIIQSPEMAKQLESFGDSGSEYQLGLDSDGHVIWVERSEDPQAMPTVFHEPPETTAWQRFYLRLLGSFVPEKDL